VRQKIVIGVFAGLVATCVWIAAQPTAEEHLAELIAELQARGEPVSLRELEAPMPADEQNGALDLDAAMEWWEANEPDDFGTRRIAGAWNLSIVRPWAENATPEQMDGLREFLVFLAPFFEHVNRAASKPELAWPLNARESAADFGPMHIPVPALQIVQRFLEARAVAGATPESRYEALSATLAIAARLRARRQIDHLVAATLHGGVCQRLRFALENGRIDPIDARARLDDVLSATWDDRFALIVRAERAHHVEALPFWIDGSIPAEIDTFLGPPPGVTKRTIEGVKRFFGGSIDLDGQAPTTRLRWIREFDRYAAPERSARDVCTEAVTALVDFNPMTVNLKRIRRKFVHNDALTRLARVALAAYEHRVRHGDWPAAPSDLEALFADGVPVDPFTGAAFVMARDGDVLLLSARPWQGFLSASDGDAGETGLVWRLPAR